MVSIDDDTWAFTGLPSPVKTVSAPTTSSSCTLACPQNGEGQVMPVYNRDPCASMVGGSVIYENIQTGERRSMCAGCAPQFSDPEKMLGPYYTDQWRRLGTSCEVAVMDAQKKRTGDPMDTGLLHPGEMSIMPVNNDPAPVDSKPVDAIADATPAPTKQEAGAQSEPDFVHVAIGGVILAVIGGGAIFGILSLIRK